MVSGIQPLELRPWQRSFYVGKRLEAEIALHGSFLNRDCQRSELIAGCALIHGSYGVAVAGSPPSPFQQFQHALPESQHPAESRSQYLLAAGCPDALLFWVLLRHLPTTGEMWWGAMALLAEHGQLANCLQSLTFG